MIPVHQDKFGDKNANCFKACLASVFEVGLKDIPSFGWGSDWHDKFQDYLMSTWGLYAVELGIDYDPDIFQPRGYHLIDGISPRGLLHAVVGLNGEMVHDPHPSGDGLIEKHGYTLFVQPLNSIPVRREAPRP
jgi:hypothetical protein